MGPFYCSVNVPCTDPVLLADTAQKTCTGWWMDAGSWAPCSGLWYGDWDTSPCGGMVTRPATVTVAVRPLSTL